MTSPNVADDAGGIEDATSSDPAIANMLTELGLSHFIEPFVTEDIDMDVLKSLYEDDKLYELRQVVGLSFGAENKLKRYLQGVFVVGEKE